MKPLGWIAILRLGVVNAALGGVVALVTFTLNRVMTVELALPAIVPGSLVALHYAVQLLRPRIGFGSDTGGRRTPWIVAGLAALSAGGIAAAGAVAVMAHRPVAGLALAVPAFAVVGAGVGAVGTSSLALLATQVAPGRRPAAATAFWVLMIFGAVLTAAVSSRLLRPFSLETLVHVAAGIGAAALVIGTAAIWGIEDIQSVPARLQTPRFATALRDVWREPASRRFTIFVFVAMLAYSAQELILEPFAGAVFEYSPAQTAALTGLHQGGVLAGMLLVGIGGFAAVGGRAHAMRLWTVLGCAASAGCLLTLACTGVAGPAWVLKPVMGALGVANGVFAVSAIGAMLGLAAGTRNGREGVRMGVWGAAQAIAMGLGGLISTGASDVARLAFGTPGIAYAAVFVGQAALFLAAAKLAAGVFGKPGAGVVASSDNNATLQAAA